MALRIKRLSSGGAGGEAKPKVINAETTSMGKARLGCALGGGFIQSGMEVARDLVACRGFCGASRGLDRSRRVEPVKNRCSKSATIDHSSRQSLSITENCPEPSVPQWGAHSFHRAGNALDHCRRWLFSPEPWGRISKPDPAVWFEATQRASSG